MDNNEAKYAMPECLVCGMRKKPYGRDAGVMAANSYCGEDCPGYRQEPFAGTCWPDERPLDSERQVGSAAPKGGGGVLNANILATILTRH